MNVLHAIHDFLPRHRAGSEIYAWTLAREQQKRHDVTVLCAEYDPARDHGHVDWRVQDGLPVMEVVNNWACESFEDTYRPLLIGDRIRHALDVVRPEIVHIHNLLNLSFDLPAMAHARGIPVVATLHDYTLVCPSGGQRIHQRDAHVCQTLDLDRCARCFTESPFYTQMTLGRVAAALPASRLLPRLAAAARRVAPVLTSRAGRAARHMAVLPITRQHLAARLEAARRVFEQIDLFVAPSPSIGHEFEQLGVPARRIRVSDYGFPPLPASARRPRSTRLRLGFVGTLVWHKGLHVLLDAVQPLPRDAYELKVFGSTDTFPDYAATLRRRAAGLPVEFLGGFDRDRAADAFAAIDVLVVPSLWLENSPLVIHEAFMAGVPVVGARMGGIPDLVTDGVNGLLYDASSPDALGQVLRQLIDRPGQLDEMRRRLPPVKSIGQDALEWDAAYAELLARRPREATAS